ncbi:2258_t:CDS:2 [Funneliformis mosseae]|uniref:2258_t:CDS:1 n=2 Tax=Funneliformis TaxID=1117308 RepID=A0A9N9EQI7_FUNMO|nr:2258_t:CDS:2 [Funneliformis mosseae]
MSHTDTTILINNSNPPITPHTQYSLSKKEVVHGIANRIIYSRFYTWLYLGMALLSSTSIILSLTERCPTLGFIILEIIINTVMIVEVGTRFLALGKLFWNSIYNIFDIILVALCIITLLFIIGGGCSHKGEEIIDSILLIARNLIQFGRIFVMLRKNKKNRKTRNATVDFSNVRDPSVSMDVDSMDHGPFLLDDEDDIF